MGRRWLLRGIAWTGVGLTSTIGLLLVLLVLITQSAFGRERVRQVAERLAGRYLLGSLHLGALRFGPGCALGIDSAAMRGPDDSLLISLGPARARCRFGALAHRQLVITSLEVARPHVVLRQSPSGVWNWSRAIRLDTTRKPPSPGPARAVIAGAVRVTDGSVVIEVPWTPPDSLHGVARDRAIDVALDARLPDVRRVGATLVQHRELTRVSIDAPLVRTGIGDTTTVVTLGYFAVTGSDPPIAVHRIAGRVAVVGSAGEVDLPVVSVGRSLARVAGHLDWRAPGHPAIHARIVADSLAFGDVAWFTPNVPPEGGGRFALEIASAGGESATSYTITGADLHSTRSVVRGDVALRIDGTNAVVVRAVALDVAPLHTDLLRIIGGEAIPRGLRGALTMRLVARADSTDMLYIDSLAGRYTDETTPATVTSRFSGRGGITLGNGAVSFSHFVVTADPLDARTVARVAPGLAPLGGRLTGTVTLDSSLEHLRIGRADLRYADGGAQPIRLVGSGRLDSGDPLTFDLKVDARPLALAALGRSYPALAGVPSFDGPIEIRGAASDMTLMATLRGRTGSLGLAARRRSSSQGVAVRATARLRDVDPRLASSLASVPSGRIDADIDVDLRGNSLTALRGTAEVSDLRGTVNGVALEPSVARVTLTDSRIVAESVSVATGAGVVTAHGALGLRPDVRDTLQLTATVSLAELAPIVRALTPRDSTTRDTTRHAPPGGIDSLRGHVALGARVIGSLDSMDVAGEIDGSDLVAPSVRASRAHATATLTGIRATLGGHAVMRVDSIAAGGVKLASLEATARRADGDRWCWSFGTAAGDRPGGDATGCVSIRTDTTIIELDSLAARLPDADLRLTRPARVRRVADGTIMLDTLEMRGSRGTRIGISGVFRDSGTIAIGMDVRDLPVLVPPPRNDADSLRVLVDLQARLDGTARDPGGRGHVRARLLDAGTAPIDSVFADVAYETHRARVTVHAQQNARRLLTARATIPVELSLSPARAAVLDEPLEGEIRIDSLNVPDFNAFLAGVSASAGVLRTHLALSGTARHPRAAGDAALERGAARIGALGIDVHDANMAVHVSPERISIREASALAGQGRATMSGFIGLADSSSVDLRLASASMPLMHRAEIADLDVSSDLRLAGPSAKPTLSGRIIVDRATIRIPEMGRAGVVGVDDTAFVRLADSLAPSHANFAASSPLIKRVTMGDVEVVMGPDVWLRSADASVQLGGGIALTKADSDLGGTEGQLALRGKLVTQRGNYRLTFGAISRSFELEEGSVEFTGKPALNPRLDINAIYSRETLGDASSSARRAPRVRAHFGGSLERPQLTLSSADSKLSQSELMSYLVTGQSSFAVGDAFEEGVVTGELVATATGALAQRLAGGMFDMVNVTPGATSRRDDSRGSTAADIFAASRLGVGKQLSSRLFLKVDAGLCALTGGGSGDLGQTLGVSLDYRFDRGLLGSLSSAPSTNGAACASQVAGRGTAATPRQWGLDFSRIWRF